MQTGNRLVLNTLALYIKNIINLLISLWTVPLVLHALGDSDYGLYNLVAGVITMLAFLNSAMTVSTQRYISVNFGKNDVIVLNRVYSTSIVLHLIIGVAIVALFEICGLFLFDGFLNIEADRVSTARIVYQFLIASIFLTAVTVPYNAVINAHEDLILFSVIGIVDSLLRLALAYLLFVAHGDRLIVYASGISLISLLNTIVVRLFVHSKYEYVQFSTKNFFDGKLMKEMFAFSGWNTFGSFAAVGRSQGIAIIVNRFFNTIVNAAYGVSNQILGAMNSFSAVLQQSINPQLMKSEGKGERERMLRISYISSKLSTMIVLIMAIPLIIEMPFILRIWLHDVPPYTIQFSRWILALSIVNQYSVGIMSAIQSGGRIGKYQLTVSILLLSNIPLSILLLYFGCPPYSVVVCMFGIEIITLFVRLLFAKNLVGYNIHFFIAHVIGLSLIPAIISLCVGVTIQYFFPDGFLGFFIIVFTCVVIFFLASWLISLDYQEKAFFVNIFLRIKNKIKH